REFCSEKRSGRSSGYRSKSVVVWGGFYRQIEWSRNFKNRLLQLTQRYGRIQIHFNACSSSPRRRDRRIARDEHPLHRVATAHRERVVGSTILHCCPHHAGRPPTG